MWPLLVLFCLCVQSTNGQFAEIASIATSLLGSGLGPALGAASAGAGAAPAAASALSSIGQLYQLAQGALQLTGTGVGVLNQASEGNWFPAALEQASNGAKALMNPNGFRGQPNLGALGPIGARNTGSQIGPEFGTGFPAPSVEDYTDNNQAPSVSVTTKAPESLVKINEEDNFDEFTATTKEPTSTHPVTLFPIEPESNSVTEPSTAAPLKEIRIELPKNTQEQTDSDYIDEVKTDGDSRVQVTNKAKSDGDESLLIPNRWSGSKKPTGNVRGGVPNLTKLIDVLRKSNLKEAEIMEIVSQIEENDNVPVPPKIDFSSAVQNIPLKKHQTRERIVKASRELAKQAVEQQETAFTAQSSDLDELPDEHETTTSVASSTSEIPTTTTFTSTEPDPVSSNRLEREIASVPVEKSPSPAPFTLTTTGFHPHQLTTPSSFQFAHQSLVQQATQQPYYAQQHPLQYQQYRQPQQQQPQQQQQPVQSTQYGYQNSQQYSTQQKLLTNNRTMFRQFKTVSGNTYLDQGGAPVVYTNQPHADYNRASYLALSAPIQQGKTPSAQAERSHVSRRSLMSVVSSGAQYRPDRRPFTPSPSTRRYPVRTVATQRLTTPPPQIRLPDGIQAQGGLLVNPDPEKPAPTSAV
ncbi:hypothetical protein Q1695_001228 [Nippostrongylus brasiliensis]|nr:hypothetical protein Q1695_001228 [Nippostrongylus brasiliensis]